MNSPDPRWEVIRRHLDRQAAPAERADFEASLREDPAFRQCYIRYLNIEVALQASAQAEYRLPPVPPPPRTPAWRGALGKAAAALALLLGLAGWGFWPRPPAEPEIVAHLTALQDCRWVHSATQAAVGDPLYRGQTLELSAGRLEVTFASGAVATLLGPIIFTLDSPNSGFLTLGQMQTRADSPQAKGFTVRTRTARIVDVGTEFIAAAAADGLSRVDVVRGEVVVHTPGQRHAQHLSQGDALSVESGQAQVLVRIESGEGTAAFRFPTLPPPSASDAADVATGWARAKIAFGPQAESSGEVAKLCNGHAQGSADDPGESVYFESNQSGGFLLDLGRSLQVTSINTYSWHRNQGNQGDRVRATQKFTLYGFRGEAAPPEGSTPPGMGWELIGRVNTDEFFGRGPQRSQPEQQASSISATGGAVGRYRYLLWDVRPSRAFHGAVEDNTLYGEIDVFGY